MDFSLNTIKRFWAKVDKRSNDECWPWVGTRNGQGYGSFSVNGRPMRAHRFSLMLHNDFIPSTRSIAMHSCDFPACCNPNHLRWGTVKQNTIEYLVKGRGPSKLNEQQVAEIKEHLANGTMTQRGLGRHYGVSESSIRNIKNGACWYDTTPPIKSHQRDLPPYVEAAMRWVDSQAPKEAKVIRSYIAQLAEKLPAAPDNK